MSRAGEMNAELIAALGLAEQALSHPDVATLWNPLVRKALAKARNVLSDAQGIEARQRHDREAGHGRNDESPVTK